MRLFGYLFLLAALVAVGLDILAIGDQGFRLRSLAETWFTLHRDSWLQLQPAVERHVHEDLYFAVVEPVTRQIAALLFAGVAAAFFAMAWALRRLNAS